MVPQPGDKAGREARQPAARRRMDVDLVSKNSAWLIIAFTMSGVNGLVIRKAGSGRSPVSSRSGIGGDEDDRHLEAGEEVVDRVDAGAAVGELDVGEDDARPVAPRRA